MQPDIAIRVDRKSQLRLREQLDLLALPPAKRRRLMNGISKKVRMEARGNIRQQRTIVGRAMAPRKQKRGRRKMLMGLGKRMTTVHKGSFHAEVTWKNTMTGQIARRHQDGLPERWTAAKARRVHGVPNYNAPATAKQAKALIREGFKLRAKKKRGKGVALKRVPQKWIRENMKLGQAGLILRLMRTGKDTGPQSWAIVGPARPFLGVTVDQANEYLKQLVRDYLADLDRKARISNLNPRYVKTYGHTKTFKKEFGDVEEVKKILGMNA